SIRQRNGEVVTLACGRCGAICSPPGLASAFEARKTLDVRAAIVPALRSLSWRHQARFSCRCSLSRHLVDDVDPPVNSSGCRASTVGLRQSAYLNGPPGLRDSDVA